MEPPASPAMGQATRLMREGRLAEAAALIQRALGHDPTNPSAVTTRQARPARASKNCCRR